MASSSPDSVGRHHTEASRREQELCLKALESGSFDEMSDEEWIALCEQTARDANAKSNKAKAEAEAEAEESFSVA